MTSFLSPLVPRKRARSTSNGGLGGCKVLPVVDASPKSPIEYGTWPKRRHKPPPLSTVCGEAELSSVSAPAVTLEGKNIPWLSQTPATPPQKTNETVTILEDKIHGCFTPISSFNDATQQPESSRSVPTETPRFDLPSKFDLAELPGSLLLPSQGFSPPPATPPRPGKLLRQNTDESDLSTLPSLTNSSSCTPPEMALFKSSNNAARRRHSVGTDPIRTTRKPLRTNFMTKPVSTMQLEELLAACPTNDEKKMNEVWLPELCKKYQEIKILLQESAELKLQSHQELKDLSQNLLSNTDEARVIANTYRSALKSAQSLLERDTIDLQERLYLMERDSEAAQAEIEKANIAICEKQESITRLQQNLDYVVLVLGSFVKNHAQHLVDDRQDADVQAVMGVLKDFSFESGETKKDRFIRVPETSHRETMGAIREARAKHAQYQYIVEDQEALIKEQSAKLDQQFDKYEDAMLMLKKQNDGIARLEACNHESQERIKTLETALQRSQQRIDERTRARDEAWKEHELSLRREDELQEQVEHLYEYYTSVINEKQTAIGDLTSQLGAAREEILARQIDLRNVMSHTQAMLNAHPAASTSPGPNLAKAHKVLGRDGNKDKDNEKPRRGFFDRKGLSPISATDLTSTTESRFSSKEFAGARSADTSKELPTLPFRTDGVPFVRQLRAMHQDSPTPKPYARSAAPDSKDTAQLNPQTPVRRVLSLIPENSAEGTQSARSTSVTSSDKEAYRGSMHALDLLNTDSVAGNMSTEQPRLSTRRPSEGNESAGNSDSSDLLSVAEMYHARGGYI